MESANFCYIVQKITESAVGPDQGPNSLQRLSADDSLYMYSKQRVKVGVVFGKANSNIILAYKRGCARKIE